MLHCKVVGKSLGWQKFKFKYLKKNSRRGILRFCRPTSLLGFSSSSIGIPLMSLMLAAKKKSFTTIKI